jgi:hypothetical protein
MTSANKSVPRKKLGGCIGFLFMTIGGVLDLGFLLTLLYLFIRFVHWAWVQ